MTISFDDVSVIPMDGERVVDHQTVIVEGERISWIGPATEAAAAPAGTQRIDGRGKFLMPGLADMHSHPNDEEDLLLLVTHGVTTIRNLLGMPRHLLWRTRIAAGQLVGPTIFVSGPIVDGRPVRANGNFSVVTRDEAIAAVEFTKRGGYDCVKVYDQLSSDAYRWVVVAARERGLPVDGHIPFQVGLHGALAAGQRSIEHLYGYPQALQPASRPAVAPHDLSQLRAALFDLAQHAELERIPELAEATRAAGTWNCATLIVRTRWLPGAASLSAMPELKYLSPVQAAEARNFFEHYPTEPERFAVTELNAAVLRGLHAAGAGLLVGTDASVPGIVFGSSVHEELHAFVDAGLTPFETLRAATSGPATFLGEAGQWGEVIPGARADLLLLDANPLTDISNTTRRAGVMVRGRWLPQSEIDDLLADLVTRRNGPPPHRARAATLPKRATVGELLHFDVVWDGHDMGAEDIVAETQRPGGYAIRAVSSLDSAGCDAGMYQAAVTVNAAGADESGWFEYDGDDGPHRVEMTRVNGSVHVRHRQAEVDEVEFSVADPDGVTLFGRPQTALYVRLAERLAGLGIGAEADVPVIAPGLPPDLSVGEATLHAVRLPAGPEDTGPRYRVEFRRPNWTTGALLICDDANRPVQIKLNSDTSYWLSNADMSDVDDESVVRVSRARSGS